MERESLTPQNFDDLLQGVTKCYSDSELSTLCFSLGVDYENLPANSKEGKARELILYLDRRERIGELFVKLIEERPHRDWKQIIDSKIVVPEMTQRLSSSPPNEKSEGQRVVRFGRFTGLAVGLIVTLLGLVTVFYLSEIFPTQRSAKSPTTFEVFAINGWQDTGVDIKNDDTFQITYVSGQWSTLPAATRTDPRGTGIVTETALDPECVFSVAPSETGENALIARIGMNNTPFNPFKKSMKGEGRLYLRLNDCDKYLYDNKGSVVVQIQAHR